MKGRVRKAVFPVGGLGTRSREPLRPMTFATVLDVGPDGAAVASAAHPEVRAAFRVPEGLGGESDLRVRLAPRRRIESDWDSGGYLMLSLGPPGAPGPPQRVAYKAGEPQPPGGR